MADIEKLIETILADAKIAGSKKFGPRVYRDEPILKTAAQMSNYFPQKYLEMRRLSRSYTPYSRTEAQIFCEQGRFMADFEDNFDYRGDFFRYFPTYQSMNDLQLRGYFSWRTKVRHGEIERTSLSFVFVYFYELINLIGVSDAQDGFDTIRSFWRRYREFEPSVDRYVKPWLIDFVVYYNLDKSLLAELCTDEISFDNTIKILIECASHTDDELFDALNSLSSYRLTKSKFFKYYPDDIRAVTCSVFRKMTEYFEKNRKYTLCEKLFGGTYSGAYHMFYSAIFCDEKKYKSYSYVIDDIFSFTCHDGSWSCNKFYGNKSRNQQLGAMLKAIDFRMRKEYRFDAQLKSVKSTKVLLAAIGKAIAERSDSKCRASAAKVEIDVSKLDNIRLASLETQDKLIVDDPEDEPTPIDIPKAEPAADISRSENTAGLTEVQVSVLLILMRGGDCDAAARAGGALLSVVLDGINEKLFDIFGDTVIDFEADSPHIVEDYADELKGIVGI